ncbi:helix-turn-helix domain-containing protein [Paremcibacter congregatus]|uniref:HTH cro/C1-type domain-containing protein n=1 Tax=Paremcibacter congregatus TaxID=2043170 RepID=A0A2G4YUZ4_9PROT|nr:helix-turn-helix transcriptional regulator [Paremcibacter congregatus]PHZ86117.1 hypothetical protein CRD36_05460 [Paremcibacter congregatus]QDE27083.1 helix-turn-helix transcriptional regulator [Paremcibacter congregatus]
MSDHDRVRAQLKAIDRHIGARLRLIRTRREISQSELGSYLGVSFQQVQKYEQGRNRLSASRLLLVSKCCHVPLHFFFQRMKTESG